MVQPDLLDPKTCGAQGALLDKGFNRKFQVLSNMLTANTR